MVRKNIENICEIMQQGHEICSRFGYSTHN